MNIYLLGFIKHYIERIIANLHKRFLNDHLYYSLCIFDPHEMLQNKNALNNYDEEDILDLVRFYGQKRRINDEEYILINEKEIKKEWDLAKYLIASYKYAKECKFTECWYKIFNTTNF